MLRGQNWVIHVNVNLIGSTQQRKELFEARVLANMTAFEFER